MKRRRNLIIAGGIYHPFDESASALASVLASQGIASEITFDVEAGLQRVAAEGFDLLTIHCLRWGMTQHEKYEPFRAEWAMSLSQEGRQAIILHVQRGGALLGLHTASICFDDWAGWHDALGVTWRWGRSHHPPIGPVGVRMSGHPLTDGLGEFTVTDELYHDLDVAPDVEVVAEGRLPSEAGWRPVGFIKDGPGGRRAYLSLGHDAASILTPGHAALIVRVTRWTLGEAVRPDKPVEHARA